MTMLETASGRSVLITLKEAPQAFTWDRVTLELYEGLRRQPENGYEPQVMAWETEAPTEEVFQAGSELRQECCCPAFQPWRRCPRIPRLRHLLVGPQVTHLLGQIPSYMTRLGTIYPCPKDEKSCEGHLSF